MNSTTITLVQIETQAGLDRVEEIYREKGSDTPRILFDTFAKVRNRLKAAQDKHADYISPFDLIAL